MKKQSMTQGTTGHKSALKMKAEQNAAMKMKKEAAMKMAANQQPMQAPAQPMAAPQQPAQQPMQQPAPTMMKKESPTKIVKDIKEGVKYAGKKLKNVKQGASDIKEGFRQLFTGDRTDSRLKKKSPSKLRKPTRKMDTAEEAPRMTKSGSATKKPTGLKPMTKEQRAKAAKETKSPAEIKKALGKRGKKAPTKHIKGTTQSHMIRHKFDGDHQDFRSGNLKKKAPAKMKAPRGADPVEVTKKKPSTKIKSPAKKKKLTDLSGDGKITQKDVLMGRGVIPTKMKKKQK